MATVVYCIVCDDIRTDPANLIRVDVLGLLARIRSHASPPFPVRRPMFSVFVVLAELDPWMDVTIRVVQADTGLCLFQSPSRPRTFPGGPVQMMPMLFRIRQCRFPAEGLFWVGCWNHGTRLARQRFYVEA